MISYLSPKEFSQVIDASESTIKRWVDRGKIKANVTDGGHRLIAVEDAIHFIRLNRRTVYRADLLGFPDVNSLQDESIPNQLSPDYFYQFLLDGDAVKARGYLVKMYLQGFSVSNLCDDIVADAMNRIGELWQKDEAGICLEHHATDICIQAVNSLRSVFRSINHTKLALGGAIEGDPYMIPSLCISSVLMAERFRTINLGPNTPIHSFENAINHYQPNIVWFSITTANHSRLTIKSLEEFIDQVSTTSIQILIGGRASDQYKYLNGKNVFFGMSMSEMYAFLQGVEVKQ